jgi:hypothetical protein
MIFWLLDHLVKSLQIDGERNVKFMPDNQQSMVLKHSNMNTFVKCFLMIFSLFSLNLQNCLIIYKVQVKVLEYHFKQELLHDQVYDPPYDQDSKQQQL